VNDEQWRAYSERLVTGEVLAPKGYGKGLPVFLPWGAALVRRLGRVFAEEFSRSDALGFRSPATMMDAAVYDEQVADFGGYDNIYRLRWRGREYVLRPDCAVDNLTAAMGAGAGAGVTSVLSVFQGFRRLKGPTPPLFRDCSIWPFVQLNRVAPRAERESSTEAIVGDLQRLFARLCLPVQIVHMGAWKNYSPELYYAVLVTPGNVPTILAMFYVVGETYRRLAGIPEDLEAFDVGLTEKILSALLLCSPDEDGVVLPSSLAPVHAVVATEDDADDDRLQAPGLVVRVERLEHRNWWRKWDRRGVPVLVERARGRTRVKTRLGLWRAADPDVSLPTLVCRADQELRAQFGRAAEQTDLFRLSCPSCAQGGGVSGDVVPEQTGACVSCGKPGRLRFITSLPTIY
jgi:hypothetical protein